MQRSPNLFALLIVTTFVGFAPAADLVTRELDLRNATDAKGRFYVIFCARKSKEDKQGVGHAFVVWAEENERRQLSAERSFGFYPKAGGKGIFGAVPGDLKNEATESDSAKLLLVTHRLTVQVNEDLWKASQLRISKWETEDYDLFRNNCVHFAYDVAGDLGLTVAKPEAEFPSTFLSRLIEDAKSRSE